MVAALYSSKRGRTKLFKYEGVEFGWNVGWDAIELMFTREVGRINDAIPRMQFPEEYQAYQAYVKIMFIEIYGLASMSSQPKSCRYFNHVLQCLIRKCLTNNLIYNMF